MAKPTNLIIHHIIHKILSFFDTTPDSLYTIAEVFTSKMMKIIVFLGIITTFLSDVNPECARRPNIQEVQNQ